MFSEEQINAVAVAMGSFIIEHRLRVWAAAILPCHVHLVFARCGRKAELVVDDLKDSCHERMVAKGIAPFGCSSKKSVWADGRWIVFLDNDTAIESAISYVVQNPIDEGRVRQAWPFVVPYCGIEFNIVSYRD